MVEGAPIQIVGHFKIYPGSPPPLVFFLFPSRQTRVCARVPLDAGKRESCRWREEKGREEKKKKKEGTASESISADDTTAHPQLPKIHRRGNVLRYL